MPIGVLSSYTQCRYCEKLFCFHLAMFLELWAMPQQSGA